MVSCSIKACLVSIVDFLSAYVYVEKKKKMLKVDDHYILSAVGKELQIIEEWCFIFK